MPDGTIQCWGKNNEGQCSPGGPDVIAVPTAVAGVKDVVAAGVGRQGTCAVHRSGRVSCWGHVSQHARADLSGEVLCRPLPAPTTIPDLEDAESVLLDASGVYIVERSGRVAEWSVGCLGPAEPLQAPRRRFGIEGVAAVSGTEYGLCSLHRSGELRCGRGGLSDLEAVSGLAPALDVARDRGSRDGPRTCVALRAGGVTCWDDGPRGGEPEAPSPVAGITDAVAVVLDGDQAFALRSSGLVAGWGGPVLGDGHRRKRSLVEAVGGLTGVVQVVTGDHTCVARTDGSVWCWGSNRESGLGIGEPAWYSVPVEVPGISDARRVIAGAGFSCAVRAGDRLSCWGNVLEPDGVERLGASVPQDIPAFAGATSLVGGGAVLCGTLRGGGLVCRRASAPRRGVSQDDDPVPERGPEIRLPHPRGARLLAADWREDHPVGWSVDGAGKPFYWPAEKDARQWTGPADVALWVSGQQSSQVVLRSGKVLCSWQESELSLRRTFGSGGPGPPAHVHTEVPGLQDVVGAANLGDTYLLSASGRLYRLDDTEPGGPCGRPALALPDVPDVAQIAKGGGTLCARLRSGAVTCCGSHESGQLGTGVSAWRAETPCFHGPSVNVVGLQDAVDVAVGAEHACAVRANGRVVCWGSNRSGAVGQPGREWALRPHQVIPPQRR
jgi:hypothetical protein